mmetsp:Transcript_35799/g.113128  ORF Transcript_35799/g.113128 Transcript_35799/m.113128 type:complete len:462 (-) Transcript_35799:45-1430(-)
MSGSVHFKFKSALNYDTVSFDGVFISVSELKKSIADKKHLPKGSEAELVVCDAQTNEEYSDDGFLLPKNTSVIVRRVPGLKPKGPLQAASAVGTGHKAAPAVFKDTNKGGDDDDFGGELFASKAKVDEEALLSNMINQTAQDWNKQTREAGMSTATGMGRGGLPAGMDRGRGMGRGDSGGGRGMGRGFGGRGGFSDTPPPGYVCHRCGIQGHFINNCPTNGDEDWDIKRVRAPVGIPMSRLATSSEGALMLPNGQTGMMMANDDVFLAEVSGLPSADALKNFPKELQCPLCQGMFRDAVLIPCCASSFCDECVRNSIIENQECPNCKKKGVLCDSLLPNQGLRSAIDAYLRNAAGAPQLAAIKCAPLHTSRRRAHAIAGSAPPRARARSVSDACGGAASAHEDRKALPAAPTPPPKAAEPVGKLGDLQKFMPHKPAPRPSPPRAARAPSPPPADEIGRGHV